MVTLLAACGADPNAKAASLTVLRDQFFAGGVRPDLYRFLLGPALVDGGETPLMLTATASSKPGGAAAAATALMESGADPALKSDSGKTARMLASDFSNHDVEQAIQARGGK